MEQTRPVWKSMIAGAIVAIVVTMVLSIIAAILISREVIPEQSVAVAGIIIALVSCFAGNLAAGKLQKGKLLITCLGSAAVYLAILLLIKAAFFGNWREVSIPMMVGMIVCGIAASFVPTGKKTYRKKR